MPIALDPNETYEVKLLMGSATFMCKYMTCRDTLKYKKLLQQAIEEKDDEKSYEILIQALGISIISWKNIDKEFNLVNLLDILTPAEAWELAHEVIAKGTASELDKKKLLWASQSNGETVVSTTKTENALTSLPK
jgi:hypothetical protein